MLNRNEKEGLNSILRDCLGVTEHDEVLVVFDEKSEEYVSYVSELARDVQAEFTFVKIPTETQSWLVEHAPSREEIHVPRILVQALFQATAVLNILDSDLALKDFRGALVRSPRRREARFAHIPGLTRQILECVAATDFAGVREDAEAVALALGEGKRLEIRTTGVAPLTVDLGGWSEEPIQSPGVLYPGSWGNVPPGETFCCPPLQGISGQVKIDGTVPGIVLNKRRRESAVLDFREGRLVDLDPSSDRLKRFFGEHRERAHRRGDSNWDCLSEIGFGLNRRITELTGNPLFDEKAYGTVHIALGDNSLFGFGNRSQWHADLVIQDVEVWLDSKCILRQGELGIDRDSYLISSDSLTAPGLSSLVGKQINPALLHVLDGKAFRRFSRSGRVSLVQMGKGDVATALADLFGEWQRSRPLDLAGIATSVGSIRGIEVEKLASCLDHFHVLKG